MVSEKLRDYIYYISISMYKTISKATTFHPHIERIQTNNLLKGGKVISPSIQLTRKNTEKEGKGTNDRKRL